MPWPRPILRFHRRGAMPNKHLLLAGNACEGRCAHSIVARSRNTESLEGADDPSTEGENPAGLSRTRFYVFVVRCDSREG